MQQAFTYTDSIIIKLTQAPWNTTNYKYKYKRTDTTKFNNSLYQKNHKDEKQSQEISLPILKLQNKIKNDNETINTLDTMYQLENISQPEVNNSFLTFLQEINLEENIKANVSKIYNESFEASFDVDMNINEKKKKMQIDIEDYSGPDLFQNKYKREIGIFSNNYGQLIEDILANFR